tara:strand:+ start:6718 stop:6978 length:261 start_codon:yes stop_codon:yes gene_type:complete
MDINELIAIIKKKIEKEIVVENIRIEDKSFLHKNHSGNEKNKYHLKILIDSKELKKMNKIESNKKIYKLLGEELKNFIHSIQIILS